MSANHSSFTSTLTQSLITVKTNGRLSTCKPPLTRSMEIVYIKGKALNASLNRRAFVPPASNVPYCPYVCNICVSYFSISLFVIGNTWLFSLTKLLTDFKKKEEDSQHDCLYFFIFLCFLPHFSVIYRPI